MPDESPTYDLNQALTYEKDGRRDPDPDDEALDVFKNGWWKGANPEQEDFGETAHKELSWHNLGYRLGKLFGDTSEEMIKEMYMWCVRQMRG